MGYVPALPDRVAVFRILPEKTPGAGFNRDRADGMVTRAICGCLVMDRT